MIKVSSRKTLKLAIAFSIFLGTLLGINQAQAKPIQVISITHYPQVKTTGIYFDKFSYKPGEVIKYFANCSGSSYNFYLYQQKDFYIRSTDLKFSKLKIPCANKGIKPQDWNYSDLNINLSPGVYIGEIKDNKGNESFAPVVIEDTNSKHAGIAVVPFQTLYAYNLWTGKSAYLGDGDFAKRDRIIYFHQPLERDSGLGKFVSYVAPLVGEIEKSHLDITYIADTSLSSANNPLLEHQAYISMGHDEYWTKQERSNILAARDSGSNLIFLGANVAYWNVRLTEKNNQPAMEIYKSASEDPNKSNPTNKFIDQGLPESEITGLEYNCFPVQGTFIPEIKQSFIFQGVNPDEISNYPRLVGPEVDELVPNDKGFKGKVIDLALALVRCGKTGNELHGTSNIVYGISPNKVGTISIGSMNWVGVGLRSGDKTPIGAFARKVTENILTAALKGKLGNLYQE